MGRLRAFRLSADRPQMTVARQVPPILDPDLRSQPLPHDMQKEAVKK